MARDDSFDERRRQREREDEEERQLKEQRKGGLASTGSGAFRSTGDAGTDKLIELLQRAEPMIEQLNNLYSQYIAGVESRPPIERRKQLDQVMQTLTMMSKPTPAYQFRYASINERYTAYRDRWDRQCKDLESGKLKRAGGPRGGNRAG